MKRLTVIAITLALASAAVAAPNGLGQATNPNRAMRSVFAQRQRNNITNDIERARAKAKRDFIESHDTYKSIYSQAEEKFKLILNGECSNWKAGCGKGVIIQSTCNCQVYDNDGRLIETSNWDDLEIAKWIKSEQESTEKKLIETKSTEITAAEDAAEKAVRDRYAEQEEKRKADEENRNTEQKSREEQRQKEKDAKRKEYDDNFDAMLFNLFGLKFGMHTNELTFTRPCNDSCNFYKLPKKFRHFSEVQCCFIDDRIYHFELVNPFGSNYSRSSISDEFKIIESIIANEMKTDKLISQFDSSGKHITIYGPRAYTPFEFVDYDVKSELTKEADLHKKAVPALQE